MRNYVRMVFGKWHAHLNSPTIDVDGEIWRPDEDTYFARVAELKAQFESSGYTITFQDASFAFWELNKANFCRIITEFAQVNNLFGFSQGTDAIVTFESPRETWSHGE